MQIFFYRERASFSDLVRSLFLHLPTSPISLANGTLFDVYEKTVGFLSLTQIGYMLPRNFSYFYIHIYKLFVKLLRMLYFREDMRFHSPDGILVEDFWVILSFPMCEPCIQKTTGHSDHPSLSLMLVIHSLYPILSTPLGWTLIRRI